MQNRLTESFEPMTPTTKSGFIQSIKLRIPRWLAFGILMVYFIAILLPLLWMLVNSFKSTAEIYNNSWALPKVWLAHQFVIAWDAGISKYFLNSVIVTILTCILTVLLSAFVAYSLSRFKFKGKSIFYILTAAGLMFAPQVSLVPLYQLIKSLGIYNTLWALILPYIAYRIPFTVLLFRAQFLGIEREFEESAYIDGCNSWGIFVRIIVPLSLPVLLTGTILTAYFAWNEFMFSLIFIDDDALKTVPTGLLAFRGARTADWGTTLAGLTLSALPIILLFTFTQKYFIRGLTDGGVKE